MSPNQTLLPPVLSWSSFDLKFLRAKKLRLRCLFQLLRFVWAAGLGSRDRFSRYATIGREGAVLFHLLKQFAGRLSLTKINIFDLALIDDGVFDKQGASDRCQAPKNARTLGTQERHVPGTQGSLPLYTPQLQSVLAPCQLVWHEPKFWELKHAETPPPDHSSTCSPPLAASKWKNGGCTEDRRSNSKTRSPVSKLTGVQKRCGV